MCAKEAVGHTSAGTASGEWTRVILTLRHTRDLTITPTAKGMCDFNR